MQQIKYPNRAVYTCQRYGRLLSAVSNWPSFLAYKFGWFGRTNFLLRTRSGLAFEIPWNLKFAFKDIFLHEGYAKPFILDRLPLAPVVLDIGANAGFFSLYALHKRPSARVLSFEPLRVNYRLLQRNRLLNAQAQWEIFQMAVSDKDGKMELFSPEGDQLCTTASLRCQARGSRDVQVYSESVDVVKLERVFQIGSIAHCDWLKIDCEGAEYEILYSAPSELLRKIMFISVEVDHIDEGQRNRIALAKFLEKNGFDIYLANDAVIYSVNRN